MNNKEIKQLLKSKADNIKITDHSERIVALSNHKIKEKKSKRSSYRFNFKLAFSVVAVCACLLLVAIPLTKVYVNSQPLKISEGENVLSKEIIAAGNFIVNLDILNDTSINNSFNMATISRVEDDDEDDENANQSIDYQKCKDIADELNSLLNTSSLLLNENFQVEYKKNKHKGFKEYEYLMQISTGDKQFAAYYNENNSSHSSDVINGILIYNNNQMKMRGVRKLKEDETKLELYIHAKDIKIKVSNENSTKENEFSYEYYIKDSLIKSVELEVEDEDGIISTEIQITENGNTTCYEFEQTTDSKMECSYIVNEIEYSLEILIYEKYKIFKFEDGTEIQIENN